MKTYVQACSFSSTRHIASHAKKPVISAIIIIIIIIIIYIIIIIIINNICWQTHAGAHTRADERPTVYLLAYVEAREDVARHVRSAADAQPITAPEPEVAEEDAAGRHLHLHRLAARHAEDHDSRRPARVVVRREDVLVPRRHRLPRRRRLGRLLVRRRRRRRGGRRRRWRRRRRGFWDAPVVAPSDDRARARWRGVEPVEAADDDAESDEREQRRCLRATREVHRGRDGERSTGVALPEGDGRTNVLNDRLAGMIN